MLYPFLRNKDNFSNRDCLHFECHTIELNRISQKEETVLSPCNMPLILMMMKIPSHTPQSESEDEDEDETTEVDLSPCGTDNEKGKKFYNHQHRR